MDPGAAIPVHPCGRVVDLISRPYRGQMRFWPDEPERLVEVIWAYAHPDAPDMPFAHCFTSSNWFDEERDGPREVGEVSRRGRGKWVPVSSLAGTGPCGSLATWQNGADDETPLLKLDGEGVPVCCRPPRMVFGRVRTLELLPGPPVLLDQVEEIGPAVAVYLLDQVEDFGPAVLVYLLDQVEDLVFASPATAMLDQVLDLAFMTASPAMLDQVEDLAFVPASPAMLDQVEDLTAPLANPVPAGDWLFIQVEDLVFVSPVMAGIDQVEDLVFASPALVAFDQVEDLVFVPASPAMLDQVEDLAFVPASPAMLDQVEEWLAELLMSGEILGATMIRSAETTSSNSPVLLTTPDTVTFTMPAAGSVYVYFFYQATNTGIVPVSSVLWLNGVQRTGTLTAQQIYAAGLYSTGTLAVLAATIPAGSNTIDVRHSVPSGTGTWKYRHLVIMKA